MGRFGGGWNWNLGIRIGGSSMILSLIWGSVTISKLQRCKKCNKYLLRGQPKGKFPLWDYHIECVPPEPPKPESIKPYPVPEFAVGRDDGCPF